MHLTPAILNRNWKRGLIAFAVLMSLLLCSFRADNKNGRVEEYKLKAAFLYNFISYIEWDPPNKSNEYVIGIIGNSPIQAPLEEIAFRQRGNKKITIKRFDSPGDITACHVLFIAKEADASLNAILAKVGKGTLTVSEKEGYGAHGAAINFVPVDNKIKFECNLKAISSSGLKASSQLLKLAIIVGQ